MILLFTPALIALVIITAIAIAPIFRIGASR